MAKKNQTGLLNIVDDTHFKQNNALYNQHIAILASLPVGVGVYANDGTMLYYNDQYCRIFGGNPQKKYQTQININNNPVIPAELKEAVRTGEPIQLEFPYDFSKLKGLAYVESTCTQVRYLEVKGEPIVNASGEIENYLLIASDVTERVTAEEKIRQSQRKIELATQAADIIFWEFDVDQKLFFTDTGAKQRDFSKVLTLEQFLEAIHPDDRAFAANLSQRMLAGEEIAFSYEDRILFPSSPEWQYCTVSCSPFEYGADGKVLKYVGTRKNNTELQRKKILQEKILNNIPVSVHIKDVENDFRYVFCNHESTRMFNTSVDKSIYDVLDEDEVSRIRKTDLEVFNTGNPYTGMERIVLKDGRIYETIVSKSIIEDNGKRLLLNIRWDQSLQNEYKRNAKLFSLTLEAMGAYTWFYEPDKKRISYGGEFTKLVRNPSNVDSLEKYIDCVHPDDRDKFASSLQAIVEKENGTWEVSYRIDLEGDGIYTWWETRGILETSILNDAPYQYMFGMSICVEAHKQAMEELNQAKKQAEQSDKLKSAFLANMSHEIRTPLNAIVGFSELMQSTDEPEEKKEYMQIISDNNDLLLKLINDILDLSKLESGSIELKYEAFDLSGYFDNMAVSMKRRITNPDLRLIAVNPYPNCIVNLDRNRIAQVLTNYVTNAIKYTPKGFIEMGYECTDCSVRFYVKDSGIGIPDEKKAKVFHRFEKLDEFAQGTGLGLSICKAIAEAMGGSVGFDSEHGKGSLFWAEFPR